MLAFFRCKNPNKVVLSLLQSQGRSTVLKPHSNRLTPDEGNAEASSERPRVMAHCAKVATSAPSMTFWGPPYERF